MMAAAKHKLAERDVGSLGPGTHPDGGNLYLRVSPTGSRSWLFRYKWAGRSEYMGLGPTRTVGLWAARDRAADLRLMLEQGQRPKVNVEADRRNFTAPVHTSGIYIARTPSNPNEVKIGMSKTSVVERVKGLGNTSSVSQPFVAVAMFAVPVVLVDRVERDIHTALSHRRVNERREFFRYTSEADLRDMIAVARITTERHLTTSPANQNQTAAKGRAA